MTSKKTTTCIISALFFFTTVVIGENNTAEDGGARWLNFKPQDVIGSISEKEPVGFQPAIFTEPGLLQYLCRVYHDGRWIPGKLHHFDDWGLTCVAAEENPQNTLVLVELTFEQRNQEKIQLLETPPGWTSWVPLQPEGSLPDNFIVGGKLPSGDPAPTYLSNPDPGWVYLHWILLYAEFRMSLRSRGSY